MHAHQGLFFSGDPVKQTQHSENNRNVGSMSGQCLLGIKLPTSTQHTKSTPDIVRWPCQMLPKSDPTCSVKCLGHLIGLSIL